LLVRRGVPREDMRVVFPDFNNGVKLAVLTKGIDVGWEPFRKVAIEEVADGYGTAAHVWAGDGAYPGSDAGRLKFAAQFCVAVSPQRVVELCPCGCDVCKVLVAPSTDVGEVEVAKGNSGDTDALRAHVVDRAARVDCIVVAAKWDAEQGEAQGCCLARDVGDRDLLVGDRSRARVVCGEQEHGRGSGRLSCEGAQGEIRVLAAGPEEDVDDVVEVIEVSVQHDRCARPCRAALFRRGQTCLRECLDAVSAAASLLYGEPWRSCKVVVGSAWQVVVSDQLHVAGKRSQRALQQAGGAGAGHGKEIRSAKGKHRARQPVHCIRCMPNDGGCVGAES
jgi:hypothetical protein